jgi:hypothetical protein
VATVELTNSDYSYLLAEKILERWDWDATFTVEYSGGVFPQVLWGRTPYSERYYIRGSLPVLERIIDEVLNNWPVGKRFFVNRLGVFVKDEKAIQHQAIRFKFI